MENCESLLADIKTAVFVSAETIDDSNMKLTNIEMYLKVIHDFVKTLEVGNNG